jgi:hypothetical protein
MIVRAKRGRLSELPLSFVDVGANHQFPAPSEKKHSCPRSSLFSTISTSVVTSAEPRPARAHAHAASTKVPLTGRSAVPVEPIAPKRAAPYRW